MTIIKNPDLVNAIINKFGLQFGRKQSIKYSSYQMFETNDDYAYVIPLTDKDYVKKVEFEAAPINSFNLLPKEVKFQSSENKPALKIVSTGNGYRLVFSSNVMHQLCYPNKLCIGYTNKGIILSNCKDDCTGFTMYPLPEQGSYALYSSQLAKCILRKGIYMSTNKGTTVFQSFEYLNDYSVVLIPFIQK